MLDVIHINSIEFESATGADDNKERFAVFNQRLCINDATAPIHMIFIMNISNNKMRLNSYLLHNYSLSKDLKKFAMSADTSLVLISSLLGADFAGGA
jgi:hypothetical protein